MDTSSNINLLPKPMIRENSASNYHPDLSGEIEQFYGDLEVLAFDHFEWHYSPTKGTLKRVVIMRCRCSCGEIYYGDLAVMRAGQLTNCGADVHFPGGRKTRGRPRGHTTTIVYYNQEEAPSPDKRRALATNPALRPPCAKIPKAYQPREPNTGKAIPVQSNGVGMRIGRLTIIDVGKTIRSYKGKTGYPSANIIGTTPVIRKYYDVVCDCGNVLTVTANELIHRKRTSCGCADGWSDAAIMYAQKYPGTYRDNHGCYRDAQGYLVLIRKR